MTDVIDNQDNLINVDGKFLVPEYTVPDSHSKRHTVQVMFDTLNLENSRKGVSQARFDALCSILVAVNDPDTDHHRFRLTQNKNEYGIQQWPIGYRPMTETVNRLLDMGWLIKRTGSYAVRQTTVFEAPDNSPLIMDGLFPVSILPWLPPVIQVKVGTKARGKYTSNNLDIAFHSKPENKKRINQFLKPPVDHLNELASQHTYDIHPFTFDQWVRKYRGGLDQSGGRLYANYQEANKERSRLHWLINGESVGEVDITACGPTILACLDNKHDQVRGIDPYNILVSKIDGMTRPLAKKICHIVIGNGEISSKRWPRSIVKDQGLKKLTSKLHWKDVREVIETDLSYLVDPEAKTSQSLRLQFHESAWLMRVLRRLLEDSVGCLPVHESIIVPRSQIDLTQRVMVEEFNRLFGVNPLVDVSLCS